MVASRSQKSKKVYFRKDYPPARAASLRSKKTSTRVKAQVSEKIANASKKFSANHKSTSTRRGRKTQHIGFITWREVTLLSSIGICALTIVFTFIYSSIFDPVKRGDAELEKIANAYYIEYYYPRILGKHLNEPEKILAEYAESGLPEIRLRQLLLSNNGKYAGSAEAFSNNYYECDTNATSVRYFPVAPYGPRDYTVTYNTVCEKVGKL